MFNKQMPIAAPGGQATCDEKIIGEHAWRLLKSFNFDPKELRGIGIQIQKLEGSTTVSYEPGQAQLPFKLVENPLETPLESSAAAISSKLYVSVQPPSDDVFEIIHDRPVAGSSRVQDLDLPSFSQVDKEVYDALPEDVRKELEIEYKRRSHSPAPNPFLDARGPSEPRDLFRKITVKGTNVKRITQQLAPKNRSVVSPKKHNIFWRSGVKITDEELQELGIDPVVFALIPEDMHREQLAFAREAKKVGGVAAMVNRPNQERKPIKVSQGPVHSPSAAYRRRPAPMPNFPEPVGLKRPGGRKGERMTFTETDDIQNVIQTWVEAFRLHPPNEKDVSFFMKFLVQSADSARSTDAGMEKSVAVLKWWVILLRRYWGNWEREDGSEVGGATLEEKVGRAWWRAFRQVKDQVDLVARKKFGGAVSLK